jgi:penicillin-insensitive murein endopeptidase
MSARAAILAVVSCGLLTGCFSWFAVLPGVSGALGTTSRGMLLQGDHLPREDAHFRSYRHIDRRFGVAALTGAIARSADRVAAEHPGSELLVGDISGEIGGFISGHRSHRSGRDADLAFYVTDLYGRPAAGAPLIRFDRFGIGVRDGEVYRFDTARNWALVEALLTDPEAEIQWIFVSKGLKALLMTWALDNGRDLGLIERSAAVLRQPGDSAPHYDHFHVRVFCPKREARDFCINTGPVWPWINTETDVRFTREELAELALEGLTGRGSDETIASPL